MAQAAGGYGAGPVRPAGPEDAAAIARVQVRTWKSAYRGVVPDEYLDAMTAGRARVERWRGILAAQGEGVALVAEKQRRAVAFATGGPCRDADPRFDAELSALYVLPTWQGRGLGAALARAVAATLATRGRRAMKVWVLERGPARPFYEHLGGRLCDRRQDVREDGRLALDEVAYAFDLADLAPAARSGP